MKNRNPRTAKRRVKRACQNPPPACLNPPVRREPINGLLTFPSGRTRAPHRGRILAGPLLFPARAQILAPWPTGARTPRPMVPTHPGGSPLRTRPFALMRGAVDAKVTMVPLSCIIFVWHTQSRSCHCALRRAESKEPNAMRGPFRHCGAEEKKRRILPLFSIPTPPFQTIRGWLLSMRQVHMSTSLHPSHAAFYLVGLRGTQRHNA